MRKNSRGETKNEIVLCGHMFEVTCCLCQLGLQFMASLSYFVTMTTDPGAVRKKLQGSNNVKYKESPTELEEPFLVFPGPRL